jgi:hypothetical protein
MDRLCPRTGDGQAAQLTLGQVLRTFLSSVNDVLHLGSRPLRVLRQLAACGTFELGAHLFQCDDCHEVHRAPRSCGERHCPRCLAAKSRHWLQQQRASLLPVTYYHAVFTLPDPLHRLVQFNPTRLYRLFFDAASQALLEFGRHRLGGELGITMVLHTWGQQLNFHPHLHCIVTGGALCAQGARWRSPKQRKFLFPVRALAALFRGKFLAGLKVLLADTAQPLLLPQADWNEPVPRARWLSRLYAQNWHLYVKRPLGGPEQVLAYLANYTHRVALSNRRLLGLDVARQTVSFTYRDYRQGSVVQPMSLSAVEFIRRFSWHILPQGLVRIRHYGILGNNRRHRDIPRARAVLEKRARRRAQVLAAASPTPAPTPPEAPPVPPRCCPHCGSQNVRWIGFIDAGGRWHFPLAGKFDSS